MSAPIYFIDNLLIYINNIKIENLTDTEVFLRIRKFFNFPSRIILIIIIIYLFITLIAVVKIVNINYGPLRQKF